MLVICAFEDDGTDFNARQVGPCFALGDGVVEFLGPAGIDAVDPADLLFDDAGIPFRVEKNDDAAAFMEVEALPANERLGDENAREAVGTLTPGGGLEFCAGK